MSGHIVLIGLSGSGKSAVGGILAARLGRPLYDTDRLLAERAGRPVAEALCAGESAFRALEEEVVRDACNAPAGVIATGGGAILSWRNQEMLTVGNLVIWLYAPLDVLVARLQGGEERPLLAGAPRAHLAALEARREPLYRTCCHRRIDTQRLSLDATAARAHEEVVVWEATRGR